MAWQRDGVLALSPYTIADAFPCPVSHGSALHDPERSGARQRIACQPHHSDRVCNVRALVVSSAALIPLAAVAVIVTASPGYAAIAVIFSLPVLWVMIRFGGVLQGDLL
jgi:hypothetical protein